MPRARHGLRPPRAALDVHPGIVLAQATRRKQRQIDFELARARRCRLVVFGIEVGARWAPEAATFVRLLASLLELPPGREF